MGKDIFSKIATTSANSKGDFFKKGSGRAVILECLRKNGDSGESFIARCKILEVKPKDGAPCNNVGDRVGYVQLLEKFKSAASNVKSFVLAVVGLREADVSAEDFVETIEDMVNYQAGTKSEYNGRIINNVQVARGMLVDFDSYDQQSKAQKAEGLGKFNTYVRFVHVPATEGLNDEASVAKRRAELDVTDPLQG